MKLKDVVIGATYRCKVSGYAVEVKVLYIDSVPGYGGIGLGSRQVRDRTRITCKNMKTGREIILKSAARLHLQSTPMRKLPTPAPVIVQAEPESKRRRAPWEILEAIYHVTLGVARERLLLEADRAEADDKASGYQMYGPETWERFRGIARCAQSLQHIFNECACMPDLYSEHALMTIMRLTPVEHRFNLILERAAIRFCNQRNTKGDWGQVNNVPSHQIWNQFIEHLKLENDIDSAPWE